MAGAWNPASVRRAAGLGLTPAERAAVLAKFPLAPDGRAYADAVFEGGGVRAVAFLGALRCLDDAGVRLRKVAGSSAGALTAAVVASRMSIGDAEHAIGTLDFRAVLTRRTSPLVVPTDRVGAATLLNLVLAGAPGVYSTAPLLKVVQTLLAGRLGTFPVGRSPTATDWHLQRDLQVVVADITRGQMAVLPQDLPLYGVADPAAFSVAEAVRLSMSIPLFFEPGALGGSAVVDGGVLSSFPLWLFDSEPSVRPRCPTLGFKISAAADPPRRCATAPDVLSGLLHTMLVGRDRYYCRTNGFDRIVQIDAGGTAATDFALTDADKSRLYEAGYSATKAFLLDRWDWERHLRERGFGQAA